MKKKFKPRNYSRYVFEFKKYSYLVSQHNWVQAQLPPRCPLQKKNTTRASNGPTGSTLEEQPVWLNDLLSDSEPSSNKIILRRASSDPLTLFNGLDQLNDTETLDSSEPDDNGSFESGCAYGPNSPRTKNKPSFPENEIVSAFSEYVVQNPLQHSDSLVDACASVGVINTEEKPMKRHPGQRSRVRKLQYIAELERTVDILQNLGSELAVRVASLLQQHVALSMENNTLKQQLLRMQQEKFIVDGEYQSLMEEIVRLKNNLAFSHNKKVHNWSHSTARFSHSDAVREMGKLNIN
ncbi:hypothetical protein ACJIZ3_022742 [Penstemon smallii]|uniref:Uncharacterized protein n=1 Tax=Penstemon smallii TaxID=265156 RepID=A0ABD3TNE7_9LAMI